MSYSDTCDPFSPVFPPIRTFPKTISPSYGRSVSLRGTWYYSRCALKRLHHTGLDSITIDLYLLHDFFVSVSNPSFANRRHTGKATRALTMRPTIMALAAKDRWFDLASSHKIAQNETLLPRATALFDTAQSARRHAPRPPRLARAPLMRGCARAGCRRRAVRHPFFAMP